VIWERAKEDTSRNTRHKEIRASFGITAPRENFVSGNLKVEYSAGKREQHASRGQMAALGTETLKTTAKALKLRWQCK